MQQWWLLAVRYTHKLPGYPALPAATTTNRAGSQTLWKIIGEERWNQQKIRRFLRRKRCHQCHQIAANIALSSEETSLTTMSNGLIALLFKQSSQKKYVIFQINLLIKDLVHRDKANTALSITKANLACRMLSLTKIFHVGLFLLPLCWRRL